MKNCLLTTFNGDSTNQDLPKFGIVTVRYWNSVNINHYNGITYNMKAKIISDNAVFIVNDVQSLEADERNGNIIYLQKNNDSQPAIVEIDLLVSGMLYSTFNISDLCGSYALQLLFPAQGDIDGDPSHGHIVSKGSIDDMEGYFPNLKQFISSYMSTRITGHLKSLAYCLNIERIDLYYTTTVIGSIEEIADAQYNSGRRTGTLTITCNGVITYEGNTIPNGTGKIITYSDSGYTVS